MSAWDISGAVVWPPLAALFWWWFFKGDLGSRSDAGHAIGFFAALSFTLAAVFCVARLFGAHA